MKRLLALVVFAVSLSASAVELIHTESVGLSIDGQLQAIGVGQSVRDPFRADERIYLFLKQARLGVSANYDDWRFRMLMAFGGEEEVKAPSPGVSLGLLDMYVDAPLKLINQSSYLRIGQFRVPYSRERLLYSGYMPFAERSINNTGFRMGRDLGVALHSGVGEFEGNLGVFVGGGRDVPERYLPQNLGSPMYVARIGYNHNYDTDSMTTLGYWGDGQEGFGWAVFANALYVKDSQVGHSSVLALRQGGVDKSLLLNANWNPFLAPGSKGELKQAGGDVAVRIPVAKVVLRGEAEVNYGMFDSFAGDTRLVGTRLQAGVEWKMLQFAVRHAALFPDARFQAGTVAITGTRPFHEVTPSLTWAVKKGVARIIVDAPISINTPVVTEQGVGVYLLKDHPDQTSVLKTTGTVARQTVVEGRLLFQANF